MAHTDSRSVIPALAFFCLGIILSDPAAAREKPWYKYENSHFEAYSNENERVTKKLLLKLENFRAAVLQVANIEVPEGVPKTQVIIFASEKNFQNLIGDNTIGGFAFVENGIPYMVLPAGGYSDFNEMVLRHEFAHVLLGYKNIQYPTWFSEGFAELMSATTFRKKGSKFSVGEPTLRRRYARRVTPWREIISADFNPHAFENPARASDAYLQSWFLTHYFMLGDDFENTIKLAKYISLLLNGQDSVAAFETVVGMSIDDFGNTALRRYTIKYVTYDFHESKTDHDFRKSKIADEDAAAIIEKCRDRFKRD